MVSKHYIHMRLFMVVALSAQLVAFAKTEFHRDVLPILRAKCQGCHRPGEAAPFPLLTYKDARPWAKAMKSAVASAKMPPWSADPAVGKWKNERRLSEAEIQVLASWADTGATEGNR
jgi:mono/diheme cytochrome c family protein